MTAIDFGRRVAGEERSMFFVRFGASDVDLRVRCESCFRLRPLSDFLDDEDPGLPAGAVAFCVMCTYCDPPRTVGERLNEQPGHLFRQIPRQLTAALRRRIYT